MLARPHGFACCQAHAVPHNAELLPPVFDLFDDYTHHTNHCEAARSWRNHAARAVAHPGKAKERFEKLFRALDNEHHG